MNELVFRDEEAGENADPEVNILVLRRPGEVQKKKKRRQHRKRIQRMTVSLPRRQSPLLMNNELVHDHHESLQNKWEIENHATSKTQPMMVSPGPNAIATTGVPFSGSLFTISAQT